LKAADGDPLGAGARAGALFPGRPGVRDFWNKYAQRFIYPPAFDMPEVAGAVRYRFTVETAGGQRKTFAAAKPWASLQPIWAEVPEGIPPHGARLGCGGQRAWPLGRARVLPLARIRRDRGTASPAIR